MNEPTQTHGEDVTNVEEGGDRPHVFKALSAIRSYISKVGIAKDGHNQQHDYYFRGIDAVMDTFASVVASHDVMILPTFDEFIRDEQKTKHSTMISVRVRAHLVFLSMVDGSRVTAGPFYGEAADSLDKATTKAQSVAYRSGMLLTFGAPLGPEADPEASIEPDPPAAESAPANEASKPGVNLSPAKEKGLVARAKAVGVSRKDLLDRFNGSIDDSNFKDVMGYLRDYKSEGEE